MGNRAPNGANKAPNRANWVPKWGKPGTLASLQLETWIFLTKITLKWKVFGNQHSPKIFVLSKWANRVPKWGKTGTLASLQLET